MPGTRLTTLDASIQTLLDELPIEMRSHFVKMHKKANLAIVPIANGVCSACGMAIPVSQVHAVHAADKIYHCPSCARFLFYPEASPRRLSQRRLRSEPAQRERCAVELHHDGRRALCPVAAGADRTGAARAPGPVTAAART